jgi:hypothetical protein
VVEILERKVVEARGVRATQITPHGHSLIAALSSSLHTLPISKDVVSSLSWSPSLAAAVTQKVQPREPFTGLSANSLRCFSCGYQVG